MDEVVTGDGQSAKRHRPILGPTDPRPALILTVVLLILGAIGVAATFLRFRVLQSMGAEPPYDALFVGTAIGVTVAIAFIHAARQQRLPALAAVGAFMFAAGSAMSAAWASALGPGSIDLYRWP